MVVMRVRADTEVSILKDSGTLLTKRKHMMLGLRLAGRIGRLAMHILIGMSLQPLNRNLGQGSGLEVLRLSS